MTVAVHGIGDKGRPALSEDRTVTAQRSSSAVVGPASWNALPAGAAFSVSTYLLQMLEDCIIPHEFWGIGPGAPLTRYLEVAL